MLVVVAQRLLREVSWGLKMRASIGPALSMLDLATDLAVIFDYFGRAETRKYGWGLLWMVGGSIFLQLVFVYVQNKKQKEGLAKELLVVLVGCKPAMDAFRVVGGAHMKEHHLVDAKTELTATKCIEMALESVPGESSIYT